MASAIKTKYFLFSVAAALVLSFIFLTQENEGIPSAITLQPNTSFDTYELIIEENNLNILKECRKEALKIKYLAKENQKYVDATLVVNGSKYDVKTKLKGTLKEHWKHPERWSFRVIIQNGLCKENGLKIFSLQAGFQREHTSELYYHNMLKAKDVLHLKYNYINFSINGKSQKSYVIEEFFDAPLLVRQQRNPGPILKFDFENYWKTTDWTNKTLTMELLVNTLDSIYKTAPVKFYKQRNSVIPINDSINQVAQSLLNNFRNQKLSTREVFDIQKLADYFAINTLCGNQHSSYLTNLRFYYDSESQKIEPIGYDLEGFHELSQATTGTESENFWPHKVEQPYFIYQLFSDSTLKNAYIKSLKSLSGSNLIENLENGFEEEKKIAKANNPRNKKDYIETLKKNLKTIEKEVETTP